MKHLAIPINITKNPETCVKGCDIVITTTPSRKPIVKAKWIKKGAHINAIGADAKGKEELEPAILKNAKVVVDSWEQASLSRMPPSPLSLTRKPSNPVSAGMLI